LIDAGKNKSTKIFENNEKVVKTIDVNTTILKMM